MRTKMRVFEAMHSLGISAREALDGLESLGIVAKSHSSCIEIEDACRLRQSLAPGSLASRAERREAWRKHVKGSKAVNSRLTMSWRTYSLN